MDALTIGAIYQAGGWVICVFVLGTLLGAFVSGRLATKGSLDREIGRADRATVQVDRMTENDTHRQEQIDSLSGQLKIVIEILTKVLAKGAG